MPSQTIKFVYKYYMFVNAFKIGYIYFSEMNLSSKIYGVEFTRSIPITYVIV